MMENTDAEFARKFLESSISSASHPQSRPACAWQPIPMLCSTRWKSLCQRSTLHLPPPPSMIIAVRISYLETTYGGCCLPLTCSKTLTLFKKSCERSFLDHLFIFLVLSFYKPFLFGKESFCVFYSLNKRILRGVIAFGGVGCVNLLEMVSLAGSFTTGGQKTSYLNDIKFMSSPLSAYCP